MRGKLTLTNTKQSAVQIFRLRVLDFNTSLLSSSYTFAIRAAKFMLRTRLLGQFGAITRRKQVRQSTKVIGYIATREGPGNPRILTSLSGPEVSRKAHTIDVNRYDHS